MQLRKTLIEKGEKAEGIKEFRSALNYYLKAYQIKDCAKNDNPDLFKAGYLEDKIALLAYHLAEYRIALTYGARAYRLNPTEERYKNNLPYYTDAIIAVNPKERLNNEVKNYLLNNFDKDTSILDVGPCWGYWSDFLHSFYKNMDAVEAFSPYIEEYGLKDKYNNIFISDIRNFEFNYYDVVILGDILEHMSVEDANAVINYISPRCKQIIVIIPYQYPQDEIDDNEYQIHKQEEITPDSMANDYTNLALFKRDQLRGVYFKAGSAVDEHNSILSELDGPKSRILGLSYINSNAYGLAATVFSDTVEEMSLHDMAINEYYAGICFENIGEKLLASKHYKKAMNLNTNNRQAADKVFHLYESLELWPDLELVVKECLKLADDPCLEEEYDIPYWHLYLLIELTLALCKEGKNMEALGIAAAAIKLKGSDNLNELAKHNYDYLISYLKGSITLV